MRQREFYHILAKKNLHPQDPAYDDSFDAEEEIDRYESNLEDKWDDRRCER